jgi:hypothetical protein
MTIDQYREQMDTEKTLHDHFGRSVPQWISPDLDFEDLVAIREGGCESGAYMPAVLYHLATATMAKHGDEVLQFIEDHYGDIPQQREVTSWAGIAVYYLSVAVELYADVALRELGVGA